MAAVGFGLFPHFCFTFSFIAYLQYTLFLFFWLFTCKFSLKITFLRFLSHRHKIPSFDTPVGLRSTAQTPRFVCRYVCFTLSLPSRKVTFLIHCLSLRFVGIHTTIPLSLTVSLNVSSVVPALISLLPSVRSSYSQKVKGAGLAVLLSLAQTMPQEFRVFFAIFSKNFNYFLI